MGQVRAERRLAAILAADVVGYSRLMAADETGTHTRLKALWKNVFKPLVAEYHGRIVKLMGDGALVEFGSAVDAVECAVALQKNVDDSQSDEPHDRRLAFRIGINIGDIIFEEDDIYGDGVNVAARLEALAKPAGICVSRNVYNQVKNKIAFGFEAMGEHVVKNIPEPVVAYRVHSGPGAVGSVLKLGRFAVLKGRRAALVIILMVSIGVGALAFTHPQWMAIVGAPAPAHEPTLDEAVFDIPSGPSIAVLPFDSFSDDQDQEYFADGLTEEIISKRTRFRELQVIARNSTHRFKGQQVDVREVGRQLDAQYVVEGSVRRASDSIRVTAQLIDAKNGAHLWAENFEADLTVGDVLELQDQITNQLVNVIADGYGVITRKALAESRKKPPESLSTYDCILRGYGYLMVYTEEAHKDARGCMERAVKVQPDYSDAWAWLSWMYQDEYLIGFNARPRPLERALEAAQRAVDLDYLNHLAHHMLAVTHFLRGKDDLFLKHAEKALAINANNAAFIGDISIFMTGVGDWERALSLANKAMRLNPYHGGVLHEVFFKYYYHHEDYEEALDALQRMNMVGKPKYWTWLAAVYGQLGRTEEAEAALRKGRELDPALLDNLREDTAKDMHVEEWVDHFMDGIRKADPNFTAT